MTMPHSLSGGGPFRAQFARAAFLFATLLALVGLIGAQPAAAQSILRDAETEMFFEEISAPLARAAGLRDGSLEIVLVADDSINAFVAGGQRIYIHTGLIEEADTANEVQGVIAHELGHIEGGHVIRFDEAAGKATGISLLSLLAGVGAALAGSGDAAMAAIMMGQTAALNSVLSYTRGQEGTADASGARYLSKAGITGKGSINFFKKLQGWEFRHGARAESNYATTHPLSGERVRYLEDTYRADPAWDAPLNAEQEEEFQRIKAKLLGYQKPREALVAYPQTDQSDAALFARAYAWHQTAYPAKAETEARKLVAREPDNPFFNEVLGQILLESGKVAESLDPLRKATEKSGSNPLIAPTFGHALVATGDPANYDEAESVLRAAVARDNLNPFAWLQLGILYAERGDQPRAALASAERQLMQNQPDAALRSAKTAMAGLPEYSVDWIRAQDVELLAESEIEKQRKRR